MFTNFLQEIKCDDETFIELQKGLNIGQVCGVEKRQLLFVVKSLLSSDKFVRHLKDVR